MIADIQKLNKNPRISKQLNLSYYNSLLIEIVTNQKENDNKITIEIVARYKPKWPKKASTTIISKIATIETLSTLAILTSYKK